MRIPDLCNNKTIAATLTIKHEHWGVTIRKLFRLRFTKYSAHEKKKTMEQLKEKMEMEQLLSTQRLHNNLDKLAGIRVYHLIATFLISLDQLSPYNIKSTKT